MSASISELPREKSDLWTPTFPKHDYMKKAGKPSLGFKRLYFYGTYLWEYN